MFKLLKLCSGPRKTDNFNNLNNGIVFLKFEQMWNDCGLMMIMVMMVVTDDAHVMGVGMNMFKKTTMIDMLMITLMILMVEMIEMIEMMMMVMNVTRIVIMAMVMTVMMIHVMIMVMMNIEMTSEI